MESFSNNFFGSLNRLIDVIKSFRGFTRFLAYMLPLAVLLIIGLAFLGIINSQSVLLILAGLFIVFILMITLTYRESKRQDEKPLQTGNIIIHVHEAGNPNNWLAGAEVRVALPKPELLATDDRGVAICIFTGDTRGKKYWARASKSEFQSAQQQVSMTDGANIYIGLKPDPLVSDMPKILGLLNQSSMEIDKIKDQTKLSDAAFEEAVNNLLRNDYVRRGSEKLFITNKGRVFLDK